MGKRREFNQPSPLERKQQGERAKKGIPDEPKKRTGYKDIQWDLKPGGVYNYTGDFTMNEAQRIFIEELNKYGGKAVWGTNDVKEVEPKKTPTEEWLEKWEQENELAEQ